MPGGQVGQVQAAEQFDPRDLNQVDREQRRDESKGKPSDEPVMQRLLVLLLRQSQHHDGHDERVVGAEQAFEHDEHADGDEVGKVEIEHVCRRSVSARMDAGLSRATGRTPIEVDTFRINIYT